MIIVRRDIAGSLAMRLVTRPTNTCAGVDNYFMVVKPTSTEQTWCPLVRFVGTDEGFAHRRYNTALEAAQEIYDQAQLP